jgi:hypothetical protein
MKENNKLYPEKAPWTVCARSGFFVPVSECVSQNGKLIWYKFADDPQETAYTEQNKGGK